MISASNARGERMNEATAGRVLDVLQLLEEAARQSNQFEADRLRERAAEVLRVLVDGYAADHPGWPAQ
jgi:hypothetical protein